MYQLIRQRHIKEAVHLEAQLDREKLAKVAEARTNVTANRAQERDRLQSAFEQVRSRNKREENFFLSQNICSEALKAFFFFLEGI